MICKRIPVLLLLLVLIAPPAHAYLDPATGSMILSAIIGLFATAALTVKTWWYRLKALFRREPRLPAAGLPPAASDERGPPGSN